MFFFNIVSRLTIAPLLPILEQEFHLRHGVAGSLYLFIGLGYATGLYVSGYLAFQFNHRLTIALSSVMIGAALFTSAWAPALWGIRASVVLLGLGGGLYLPSGIAALTENTPQPAWGKALAIHELGPNLAYICAPLLAELLLGFVSWRGVLRILGMLALLLGLVFLLAGLGGPSKGRPPSPATVRTIARDPALWAMAGLFAVAIGAGIGLYTMLPLFLVNEVGLNRMSANLITGLTRVSAPGSVLAAGLLTDRIGRRRTIALSLAGAGCSTLALGLVPSPWTSPFLIFVQAAFAAAVYPSAFAIIAALFPLPLRNVAISMIMIVGVLFGAGAVPPIIGMLADRFSFSLAFTAAGLTTLVSLLLLRLLPPSSQNAR